MFFQKLLLVSLIVSSGAIQLFSQASLSAKSKMVAGPMLGYIEHFEALVWLEVSPNAEQVAIKYFPSEQPEKAVTLPYNGQLSQAFNPIKFKLIGLQMNTSYQYEIWIDGAKQAFGYPLNFKTKELWEWRKDAPSFSFVFGSCAYINDTEFDRPGTPYGQDVSIFKTILNQPSDFMIWGGDNLYLREVDWSSEYGINYRYSHDRRLPELQQLLSSRSHFATWDDHDFGPNNSDKSYGLKNESLHAFTKYWGNKSFGEADNPGVYGKFTWADAEFFMLDDRYHRSNEAIDDQDPSKSYFGERQLEWLKNSLLSSNARFKFIVSGNQILNPMNQHESFQHYQSELNDLMGFITKYDIWGIVFLTGDRHFTEMIAVENPAFYTLYDITCSPLTSSPYLKIRESKEGKNPSRVENTLANVQNFIKITASGTSKERQLLIQCFDIKNQELWQKTIYKNDLRSPKKDKD